MGFGGAQPPCVVRAATLVGLARHTPRPVLRLATMSPTRSVVVGQIFKRMPELVSAAGRKARGVIRFDIGTGSGVDTWYVVFADGTCETTREVTARPRVTISMPASAFVELATGTQPIELFSAGKLRLAGDTYFGASVGELFDLPR